MRVMFNSERTQRRKDSKRARGESGSALIEFTLTLLPLLGFIFLTIDIVWIIFAWGSIQEGAREGVRFAVTGQILQGYSGQDASIRAVVQQYSSGFVNSQNASSVVNIQYYLPTTLQPVSGVGSNAGGNVVKITVSGISVHSFAPILRTAAPIAITASSSDVMEGSPNGIPPAR